TQRCMRFLVDDEVALISDMGDEALELLRRIDVLDESQIEPRVRRGGNDRASLSGDAAAGIHRVDVQRRQVVAELESIGAFGTREAEGFHQRRRDVRYLVDRTFF